MNKAALWILLALAMFGVILFYSGFGARNLQPNSTTTPSLVPIRVNIAVAPHEWIPQRADTTGSHWVLESLHSPLLRYSDGLGLIDNLAQSCTYIENRTIRCELKPNLKWSNGQPLTFEHIRNGFEFHLHNRTALSSIIKIITTESSSGRQLNLYWHKSGHIDFVLNDDDRSWIYHLADVRLAPLMHLNSSDQGPPALVATSGVYQVSEIQPSQVDLEPNRYHWSYQPQRPQLRFLVVPQHESALRMYKAGELDLLRILPTAHIEQWQQSQDLIRHRLLRFDYIGAGPQSAWRQLPKDIRSALGATPDWSKLGKLYYAPLRPGCFPAIDSGPPICFKENQTLSSNHNIKWPELSLYFSSRGGYDILRGMEWLKLEWQKVNGPRLRLVPTEHQWFLHQLQNASVDLFRKAVIPLTPTCSALLGVFESGHLENYIKFTHSRFDMNLKLMRKSHPLAAAQLCRKNIMLLKASGLMLPLGQIQIFRLLNPKIKNLRFNQLGSWDLSSWTKN